MGILGAILEFIIVLLKSVFTVLISVYHCIIPERLKSIQGKVILITGAGGGLGSLLSQKLAVLGAKVVLVDTDEVSHEILFLIEVLLYLMTKQM